MTSSRTLPTLVLTLLLMAAGCTSGAEPGSRAVSSEAPEPTEQDTPPSPRPSPSAGEATSEQADGSLGWIGGEPAWTGGVPGGDALALAETDEGEDAGVSAGAAGPVPTSAAEGAAPVGDALADTTSDIARDDLPPSTEPLRAGSVDDNVDFPAYLAYLQRIADLGISLRPFDPTGRIVVSVTGTSGLPVQGAQVSFSIGGADVAQLRTTADGSVRFHPAAHGAQDASSFQVTVGDATASADPGDVLDLVVSQPGGAEGSVPVDVLFLLDATGSMGDEIDRLKTSIDSIAARLQTLEGQPDLRYGMTLYRDIGDSFVTATYDLTADVEAFREALAEVVADGGGDHPEALDEALAAALGEPTWRDPSTTVQLVFLVADAPPQIGRQVEVPYTASLLDAAARGIEIFPVASSSTDDTAEAVFRQLAQGTGGRFVFLTYGAGGAATGGSSDIDRTDYEELSLDDLIVRLVAEELATLTGDTRPLPTPVPTATTPPGQ